MPLATAESREAYRRAMEEERLHKPIWMQTGPGTGGGGGKGSPEDPPPPPPPPPAPPEGGEGSGG